MEIIRALMPSDLDFIKEFRDGVILNLEKKNIDSDLLFKIKLILDELIINSYKHGNNYDCNKLIEAVIVIDKKSCTIKIKDEGDGINYVNNVDNLSDHGRGIRLVNSLSDGLLIKDNIIAALILNDNSLDIRCNT